MRRVIHRNCCAVQHTRGERLLPFGSSGHSKFHAAIFVRFRGGGEIEVGQRNFLRALRREDPERLAYYGVILHFFFALISKHEYRRRRGIVSFVVAGRFSGMVAGPVRRWRRGRRGVNILILLVEESLLFQASLVHFFR